MELGLLSGDGFWKKIVLAEGKKCVGEIFKL